MAISFNPEQVIVTGIDGYGIFQVADGSTFEVFPKSRVVFRANRGDWRDLLEVWLGKVRVQIEHAGGLPNHNKVRTPSAVIFCPRHYFRRGSGGRRRHYHGSGRGRLG